MQNDEITERVIKVIRRTLPQVSKADLEPPSGMTEDVEFDSLQTVQLVLAFEDEFDIKIPNDAVAELRSVKDIVTLVVKQIEMPRPE